MQIGTILILTAAALALRLAPPAWRRWLVFAASVVILYWLQPGLPVRGLTYWLPTATLFLVVLGWLATGPAEARWKRGNATTDPPPMTWQMRPQTPQLQGCSWAWRW